MKNEPNRAQKKDPPTVESAARPGPAYDPMDRIVQDLQNIQSFLGLIEENPGDLGYVESHYPKILMLRRTLLQQLDKMGEDPTLFPEKKVIALKKSIEEIFSYLEGAVSSLNPLKQDELKRFIRTCEKALSDFDGKITP